MGFITQFYYTCVLCVIKKSFCITGIKKIWLVLRQEAPNFDYTFAQIPFTLTILLLVFRHLDNAYAYSEKTFFFSTNNTHLPNLYQVVGNHFSFHAENVGNKLLLSIWKMQSHQGITCDICLRTFCFHCCGKRGRGWTYK